MKAAWWMQVRCPSVSIRSCALQCSRCAPPAGAKPVEGSAYPSTGVVVFGACKDDVARGPSSTSRCASDAAAWRRIDLNPINDLGYLGTTVRACISSITLITLFACCAQCSVLLARCPFVSAREQYLRRGAPPTAHAVGGGDYNLFWRLARCAAVARARTRRPMHAVPRQPRLTGGALRALQIPIRRSKAASTASARSPTTSASPPTPPAPPPTSPPTAESSPREVRAQCHAVPHAHDQADTGPTRRRRAPVAAATPPHPRARVALDSPSPARLAHVGLGAAAPRRNRAPREWPPARRVAHNGRNGRRTRAPAVGADHPDYGSFGGVCSLRAVRRVAAVAAAAAVRPPRGRPCARLVRRLTRHLNLLYRLDLT